MSGDNQSVTDGDLQILQITQATTAVFTDLYFRHAFLFFIENGSKRVVCPVNGEVIGQVGDVMIFPQGSLVTMQNRPVPDAHYRATGLGFPDPMIKSVFGPAPKASKGVQIIRANPHVPDRILSLLNASLQDVTLPEAVRQHRMLEPLIWLQSLGVTLSLLPETDVLAQARNLIEGDITRDWRSADLAAEFGMSEATLRRRLADKGMGFAKILLNTRLEKGLNLLQTTDLPISAIAMDCGFKTPSHFSDAFRKRFGIQPKEIRISAV